MLTMKLKLLLSKRCSLISLKSMKKVLRVLRRGYREITSKLKQDNLDLNDCCGQMYDNAAMMSGKVFSVQKLLSQKDPKAKFMNCDNHSLNLVGVHAASEHVFAISFFGVLDLLYNFYSSLTMRWEKLKEAVGLIQDGVPGAMLYTL